ncbi:hypothetical protein K0M31_019068 [Melipona bicolor]|uniref:Uncharacterized protein n=1 Tax=Melipona bicolor TaxID=60889 RepID=A0AA40KDK3_9HYME|nr:hypothetical protein K0M31_019068 [Melipona bicolor]
MICANNPRQEYKIFFEVDEETMSDSSTIHSPNSSNFKDRNRPLTLAGGQSGVYELKMAFSMAFFLRKGYISFSNLKIPSKWFGDKLVILRKHSKF